MAVKFYKEPWVYLATAKPGAYLVNIILQDGSEDATVEQIMSGLDSTPDVEITFEDGKKDKEGQSIDIDVKPPKEGHSTIVREPKEGIGVPGPGGRGKGEGGKGQGDGKDDGKDDGKKDDKKDDKKDTKEDGKGSGKDEGRDDGKAGGDEGEGSSGSGGEAGEEGGDVLDESNMPVPPSWVQQELEHLNAVNPHRIRRYLEIFAGTPKTRKIFSESGDAPDLQRLLESEDPFPSVKVIEGKASLSAGVTVDISGSTKYNRLAPVFRRMARSFTALNYFAGVSNQNLHYSLSAVGDDYHQLLRFENSKDKTAVEESLEKLKSTVDDGGINTVSVIKGLQDKYKGQLHKKHRIEFVFTDGDETSHRSFARLRSDLNQLEKSLDLDVVFIGIGSAAEEVKNYSKYVYFPTLPSEDEMMDMIESLSILKVKLGLLPEGDVGKLIGIRARNRNIDLSPSEGDKAMQTAAETSVRRGGIDLTDANKYLQTRNAGEGIKFQLDPAQLQQLQNAPGFVPVIINIQPMRNLRSFLGLKENDLSTVS